MNEWVMVGIIAVIFLVTCFFLEAVVIKLFRLSRLGRAFVYALLANFVSLLLIYLGWPLTRTFGMDTGTWFPLFPLLWGFTVFVETLVLKGLARQQSWTKLFQVVVVMNLVSFAALYLVLMLL